MNYRAALAFSFIAMALSACGGGGGSGDTGTPGAAVPSNVSDNSSINGSVCDFSDKVKPGVSYQYTYATTETYGNASSASTRMVSTAKVSISGGKSFNGATDLIEIAEAHDPATTTTPKINPYTIKSYYKITPDSRQGFGYKQEGSINTIMTVSPASKIPRLLTENQPYSETVLLTAENLDAGTVTKTEMTTKYTSLGLESITTPLGTFKTCKLQQEGILTSNAATANGFSTFWTIAEGAYRGIELKSVQMVKAKSTAGAISETTTTEEVTAITMGN